MTCVKCGRDIDEARVSAAIKLGDGRAALDWPCFDAMLKPGRAAELMRLLREATVRARSNGALSGASERRARAGRTGVTMKRRTKLRRDGRGGEPAICARCSWRRRGGEGRGSIRPLDAAEAARFLGLAEPTVRDMTYRRELPCVKVGARGVRYQMLDLI